MFNTKLSKSLYSRIIAKRVLLLILMAVILLLVLGYSITLGVADITMKDVYGVILQKITGITLGNYTNFDQGIILKIRLPRVLLGLITGLSLGANGTVMQSLLRNPLASPYTLGVSSASALGAGMAIVLGNYILGTEMMVQYGSWIIIMGSFVMGILSIILINVISSLKKGGAATLILAGVALSYLFSAGISFLKYTSNHEQLAELTIWLMGGLYRAEWIDVLILTPIMIICFIFLIKLAWDINTLNAGEEVAENLGIDVKTLRRKGSFITALLTSCVVAFTGIIGFVGLLAPHVCRMIFGNDNRFLIIASGLMGAIILVLADTAARLIINPTELPIGIITSICGAPFFLYILIRRKSDYF
ncbi:iron ABC transporter permease [Halocella sp. SP3-1]|uniref:FecCD family ABC transporter permease n=1 Tax=Halocella sp. SP3-1 TaxID=2382161 RepID=UPI0025704F0D|nr:iron ABC transporter permease [Halocella sp. SP3-1]